MVAWFSAMLLVLMLSSNLIGSRLGVLLAGLFLAIPCFVWALPLPRVLLMCFMGLPFATAAALVLAPPIPGFRSRLAYLCNWSSKSQVKRHARFFDRKAVLRLLIATAVFAFAIAAIKAVSPQGWWLIVRWLAGGMMIYAFAEMATVGHNLVTAALGISVPPFFQSPHGSLSVGEFWTRRWNLPAAELFRKFCFMPVARHGVWLALSLTFMVSAVAHVLLAFMAIGKWKLSIICGAFFLAQPLLIFVERQMAVRRWPPTAGRIWAVTALAITSPLLVEPALQISERSWGASNSVLLPDVTTLGFVTAFCLFIALASLGSCSEGQARE